MKKFVKKTEGFTLVELIVVIAILGVLAGVGTVGYSGYIQKAHMSADQQLVGNVKSALELAFVGNLDKDYSKGAVVLTKTGATVAKVDGAADAEVQPLVDAMVAYFGANWADLCKLQYEGWESDAAEVVESYQESSYAGNETDLLGKMGMLTGAMAGFLEDRTNLPKPLEEFMEKNNVQAGDTYGIANSTALLIAQDLEKEVTINGVKKTAKEHIANALRSEADPRYRGSVSNVYAQLYSGSDSMRALATAATIYAYAEAYATHAEAAGNTEARAIMDGLNDTIASVGATSTTNENLGYVLDAFDALLINGNTPNPITRPDGTTTTSAEIATTYFSGSDCQAVDDAKGFLAVMGAVSENADTLVKDVHGNAGFYTDGKLEGVLNAYIMAGSLAGAAEPGTVVVAMGGSGVAGCNPMGVLG